MRPIEHFLSQLDKLEQRSNTVSSGTEDQLSREFISVTTPVIGRDAAQELCDACLDRLRGNRAAAYIKLGYVAAFLVGEFDDTMELNSDEWDDIRDTLEDAAGEIDMNTLTTLMGDLLARGRLG
jgi:hypothetical protein